MTDLEVDRKSLAELTREAAERRSQRRQFIAWITLPIVALVILGLVGSMILNARFNAHPLIGGVAPRKNQDSINYTLIDFDFPKEGQKLRQYHEWVVRLPKSISVYGVEDRGDTKIWGGGLNLVFKHRNNQLISWQASFDTLEPMFIDPNSPHAEGQNEVSIWLYGETVRNEWKDVKKRLDVDCVPTGKTIGDTQEYAGRVGKDNPQNCNEMGYLLWSKQNPNEPRGRFECQFGSDEKKNELTYCKYYLNYGRKEVWGDYPVSKLSEAATFFDRLENYLKSITIADGPLGDVAFVNK
jgi:hypothetical protein